MLKPRITEASMPSHTIEEYLEAIYSLSCEGQEVIGARLAEALHVSPPTVTATLQRMVRDGLVSLGDRKEINLTAQGQQTVEKIVRRHRLSERLLVDVLGMDWHEVHDEACRLEHAISDQLEQRLVALLGDPETCPHGNPIPGKQRNAGERRLVDAKEGESLTLHRVAQSGETEPGLLLYLEERGLTPGVRLEVIETAPFNGPIVVQLDDRKIPLGRELAAMVWVRRGGS
jgi:DtxR family transcriptional regulator, Mn-dependent transcriptional regulator